jgi:hypothetical protein
MLRSGRYEYDRRVAAALVDEAAAAQCSEAVLIQETEREREDSLAFVAFSELIA